MPGVLQLAYLVEAVLRVLFVDQNKYLVYQFCGLGRSVYGELQSSQKEYET